jgi:hypothetical protein
MEPPHRDRRDRHYTSDRPFLGSRNFGDPYGGPYGGSYGGYGGGYGGMGGYGGPRGGTVRLEVFNLPWSVDWKILKDEFKRLGFVVRADVYQDPDVKIRKKGVLLDIFFLSFGI